MSKSKQFVGIDVSKKTFDVAIIKFNSDLLEENFSNSTRGINQFLKWLNKNDVSSEECLIGLERTGIYSELLTRNLQSKSFKTWVVMPYTLQRSMGLQRGKSDRIDAKRIAEYIRRYEDKAVLEQEENNHLVKIKKLLTLRNQLIKASSGFKKHLQELKLFDNESYKLVKKIMESSIDKIKKNLKKLENKIEKLYKKDEEINKKMRLGLSVVGVGKITMLHILTATNLFKNCSNAKQLACYSGVVPFEYSSGTSVNKKSRVHFMANKKIKSLLHLCAMSSINHDPELKKYYERKVEEGKPKMLVLNNVKNKLIHRIYSVIKRDQPYEKKVA